MISSSTEVKKRFRSTSGAALRGSTLFTNANRHLYEEEENNNSTDFYKQLCYQFILVRNLFISNFLFVALAVLGDTQCKSAIAAAAKRARNRQQRRAPTDAANSYVVPSASCWQWPVVARHACSKILQMRAWRVLRMICCT